MQHHKWNGFPKVELHCHLDGSLSPQFFEKRLGREVPLSRLQVEKDCRDLAQYLEKFDLPVSCLQDEKGLREAGYDFVASISREHVIYAEVRFAPLLSAHGDFTCTKVIRALLEGLQKGREEFGIICNVIVCAMRQHTEEENLSMIREAREFLGHGVCAADLAGNEAVYPMSEFKHLFSAVRGMGMPFTIHAGECGNVQNILDSIEVGASRIGHGIAMHGNREVQEICRQRGIGIEMCPLSNLQTRAVKNAEQYPLREYLDAGLLVTINTDNRTVSGTTLSDEFALIQEMCQISDEDIVRMQEYAIATAFAEESLKNELFRRIRTAKKEMEKYV